MSAPGPAGGSRPGGPSRRPDRIFVEARILRPAGRPAAQAMAVAGEWILAVGGNDEIRRLAGPGTEIVGLGGAVVAPGFHDGHLHLASGAVALAQLDLRGCRGPEEVARRVARRAARLEPRAWVRGWGWDDGRWPAGCRPHRAILDAAAPATPVFLFRIDGHVAWLNSAALREVGIGPSTPDPPGGAIEREPGSGDCTGILVELAADLARHRLPPETEADRRRALERGLGRLARHGITSVEDVTEPWALPVYARLRDEGRLTARISAWLPAALDEDEAEELRRRFPPDDPWLRTGTLKFYLDGTLGARSAALREPYSDDPAGSGLLRVDPAELAGAVTRADAAGWSVALHAIGDRALAVALAALEGLPAGPRARPHRVEHVQVVTPGDARRLARVGAVASVQPVHLIADLPWVLARLGAARAARAYPWRSLLRAGAVLAMGTDWPVAPLDPREGLAAATGRMDAATAAALRREREALSPGEAWEAYTLGPARAAGRAGELGTLEPGHRADFVVLSADPSRQGRGDPRSVDVRQTFVGGRGGAPAVG